MSAQIVIILGSESDKKALEESKVLDFLQAVEVPWEVSIISAHRNPHELTEYCSSKAGEGASVFICVAGMAAALPGATAAVLAKCNYPTVVIGVPLPSSEFPGGEDALLSMVRMPPGLPVAVCGIGKPGLRNAAIFACQILATANPSLYQRFNHHMVTTNKQPQLAVMSSEKEKSDGDSA